MLNHFRTNAKLHSHCATILLQPQVIISIQRKNSLPMSLWSSYRNLTPRTRLLFGAGLMAYATFGMWWSPKIEEALGMVPTKEEQEELERKMTIKVSSVERQIRE
ncbi:hypothetical protein PABG_02038 [Paracoccidioides brasiliensis Pb03]|uniref:Uncharacterized protein n=2 Tax=Paracoccidioides brasiliensis TaxID=121759 RepID=C1G0P5_PARBD|nr:uncharacterized protein PADG_00435 [Paracoccidioides brasiliensis Pb18]EEH19779.1 hypothetical protein PABG_02038 [Paracoccidioides brasiliensis Pb03]EEH44146.1 hypothetical protein PADG_00435 [Paracoccidioides brasiliensis Pb18]ODH28870.1 hypothetical protein ACO22_03859 [Paracoccidioides brasiliensis]